VLQSAFLGYFSDTILSVVQWFILYILLIIISHVAVAVHYSPSIDLAIYTLESLLVAIFLEAVPEELLKYAIVYHISTVEPLPSKYGTVVYTIYASLGFIFFSGTLRIIRVYWLSGITQAVIYFFIESCLTSTMQIITGLWIGLNFVKQQFREPEKDPVPAWRVVLPSIVYHAVYMCLISVMYLLFYFGELGWQLFGVLCIILFASLIIALYLTYPRVKKLFSDPSFYALLNLDDQVNEVKEDSSV